MSALDFARWLHLVALWGAPPDVRFTLLADVTGRSLIANLEREGVKAQVQVEAGTPADQVHRDLDEFRDRLVLAARRRERDRGRQRKAAYDHRPAPN